jgi:hypothetical protein
MKQFSLFLVVFFAISSYFSTNVYATHYMGGEITWECIPSGQANAGKYIFTMKLYRECYTSGGNPASQFPSSVILQSNGPTDSISMTEIVGWPKDISPICNSNSNFPHIHCFGMSNGVGNMGACQEHIYRSGPIQLNGVPPVTGWMFYWGSCCRNSSENISGQPSFRLRAIMYPYGTQNAYPCFDNSPVFAEKPRTVIAVGYEFSYNNLAYDQDYDSLSFEWGQPLLSTGVPITAYANGYSYNNPLPGPSQNPSNISAVMDSISGQIHFKSYTAGAFVTSVKVSSYRCGIKIAEIWRDIQVVLIPGGTNAPPDITPPFSNGTSYNMIVTAGTLVNFSVSANDFQFLANGSPQNIYLKHFSSQFGEYIPPAGSSYATLSSTTGCLKPPCATLFPAPGPNAPISGIFGIQTGFSWQTTCAHLLPSQACSAQLDTVYYQFLFTVWDDYCPVPGQGTNVITIGVTGSKHLDAPVVDSVYFDYTSNIAHLSWQPVIDPNSYFKAYYIYYSPTLNGNYTLIDSILNISSTSYLYTLSQPQNAYFKIRTKSANNCNQLALSDYSSVISMNITGVQQSVKQQGFVLYPNEPNPADAYTNIRFSIAESSNVEFVLTDVNGRIIDKKKIQAHRGDNSFKLSLEGYNAGIYYYSIIYKNQKKTSKLMVK